MIRMSLTKDDLVAIRDVINEAFDDLFEPRFDDHDTRLGAHSLKTQAVKNELSDMNAKVDAGLFAVNQSIEKSTTHLDGRIDALEADVKELYKMISKIELGAVSDKRFAKLSLEKKFLLLYEEFQAAAKEANITLPR
jgi:hypothetical protein